MSIIPINRHVVIKPVEVEERTKGGIYIPESAKEDSDEGEVVAVANEPNMPPIKKGDKVIYAGYSGKELTVAGEKVVLIDAKDILAVLK